MGPVATVLLSAVFFALFYLYVWQVVDPQVLYYADDLHLPSGQSATRPVFQRGWAFFAQFLDRPGGVMDYVAAGAWQYYYYPRVGPFLLTAVAWLVFLLSGWLIGAFGGAWREGLRFVPPLLLLVALNQYAFPLETFLALVVALTLANGYLLAARNRTPIPLRALLFTLASAAAYYLAAGLFWLFALWCVLFEWMVNRRYLLGGGYVLAAVGAALVWTCCGRQSPADACFRLTGVYPWDGTWTAAAVSLLYGFYVAVPLAGALARGWNRLLSAVLARAGWAGRHAGPAWLKPIGLVAALAVVSPLVARYTLDGGARTALRVGSFARREMWPEFLREIDDDPPAEYPPSLLCDVNRALFETGQLGSKMFSYPQRAGVLFQIGEPGVRLKGSCEVLMRLGCVNEAEHTAHEALEMTGNRPETLRQLALINVAKGRSETARVFLGVLKNDIIRASWAEDCLRRLDEDPLLADDEQVSRMRWFMPHEDRLANLMSEDDILLALLERNKKNRMAFEYLMAQCLLTRQPQKIAGQIARWNDFDGPDIPVLYAEAIALYAYGTRRRLDLGGRTIQAEVLEQVAGAAKIVRQCRGDNDALRKAMAARFPHSVSRYFFTGESGGGE